VNNDVALYCCFFFQINIDTKTNIHGVKHSFYEQYIHFSFWLAQITTVIIEMIKKLYIFIFFQFWKYQLEYFCN